MNAHMNPNGVEMARLFFSPKQKSCLVVGINEPSPLSEDWLWLVRDRRITIEAFIASNESEKLYQYDLSTIGGAENIYEKWKDGSGAPSPFAR